MTLQPRVRRSTGRPNYATLDLFAGCGGLTEGFTSARDMPGRFVPIAAVELDEHAAATYSANFGSHVFQGDINDWIAAEEMPNGVDVVVGGPPCQGFSALGKRDPDDERNKLWIRYAEVVRAAEPQYFVLENVALFMKSPQYDLLRDELRAGGLLGGYELQAEVVVASDFGAAQKRHRTVLIGRRAGLPEVDIDAVRSSVIRTVRDAFRPVAGRRPKPDLPEWSERIDVGNGVLQVPGVFETPELHVTRHYTELSLQRFATIPAGGNRFDLPIELQAPCWRTHTRGSGDVMGRLHWDRPSVTIRTEFWKPEKGRYLHPVADRAITHMEAALLQGFPPAFRWCGTKVTIGRQIGNAVPVELGRAVARSVLAALDTAGIGPKL